MESMILKNIKMIYFFDYEGFLGRNLSASYAPKENDEQYKNFIFLLSELFEKIQ